MALLVQKFGGTSVGSVERIKAVADRIGRCREEGHDVVELDEERKASMVSNLLVVLTSETNTTPVVNAGSLY